ncbi:MAG: AAA family ATPase [Paraglaciecola sp.]|uniref:AAA family ATPase n=1 Tax=Paraglaciecola sp. TaxID=1920173 RepID=UPI00329715B0
MAITSYKPVFSEYHHGPDSYIHLLSKPVSITRDTAISHDDADKLKNVQLRAAKNISTKLVFCGNNNTEKARQLNQLAHVTKQTVCFLDCHRLVEKYIGETEKNLSKLIAQAESRHWILFFDEADALFAKATEVQDSQDKYANQEISYLLKRISLFPSITIFSLKEQSKHHAIKHRVDDVISFRDLD